MTPAVHGAHSRTSALPLVRTPALSIVACPRAEVATGIPITVGASSNLFAVCTDVHLNDALQEASDALDAAIAIIMSEAADSRTAKLFGGVTLMQIAKGVVDAAIVSVEHGEVAHA